MKSRIFITISSALLFWCSISYACGPWYYDPGEYYMYRISDHYLTGQPYSLSFNYGSGENCQLWQQQTSKNIPLDDIYQLVYKGRFDWIEGIAYHTGTKYAYLGDEHNQFAEWLWKDTEAAEFLLLAKKCENTRAKMCDPWYYPAKKDPEKLTLDDIIREAMAYKGKRFADRYVLQVLRAMFSLKRYDDCVNYWNETGARMPDNIIHRLSLRYVAGAYYNRGEIETAMKLFGEAQDVESVLYCAQMEEMDGLTCLYENAPSSPVLRAKVERAMINLESGAWRYEQRKTQITEEDDLKRVKYIHDLSLRIAQEGKVDDPDLWYYTAAFAEHLMGRNADAAWTLAKAEKSKGSEYIKESIRVFKLYLAALGPYSNTYEADMVAGIKWLDEKIVEHLDEARSETISHGMYYTNINISYYYWNDMLRKIVHSAIVPRLMKSNNAAMAIAFSNMADNYIFKLVGLIDSSWTANQRMSLDEYRTDSTFNSLDFSNQTFDLMDGMKVESIIDYVRILENPKNDVQRYLNSRGYTNLDYFREIIGTMMIREMRYADAVKWLSMVPSSYQTQLNTFRDGYFRFDPFLPERTQINNQADYKYNFAREMLSLEKAISDTKDPNRKALLITRYATGIKNTFGNSWALAFYRLYASDTDADYGPTVFSAAQDKGFTKAEYLYKQALSLCRDKETAAQINYFLGNRKTVVSKYKTTRTAAYIRGHCDTYSDYHFEKKSHFWDYCHAIGKGR